MCPLTTIYVRQYSSLGTDATDATDGHLHSPQGDKSYTHARPQQNAFSAGTTTVLLCMCPHICVLIYVCPHTTKYVSVVYVSSYYYIRVCSSDYKSKTIVEDYKSRRPEENAFSASTA